MGDPAFVRADDPLSIEGLSEIFELAPVTKNQAADAAPVTDAKEPVTRAAQPMPTSAEGVPVEEAALLIGTSINAAKKRLRKGTLRGTKVETKHGEKWFVDSSELAELLAPVTKNQAADAAPVTDAKEPVTPAAEPMPTSADIFNPYQFERIQELERKLEGATYRNGYLEAENEGLRALLGAHESQIKLLTDSQRKKGHWWERFSAWFIGRS